MRLSWLSGLIAEYSSILTKGLYVQHSSEVHANAAETLAAVTRIAPSALASKLASPKFAPHSL